jgi:hypothetical protein
MTLSVTPADVLSFNPCEVVTPDFLRKHFAGRSSVTANEILDLNIRCDYKLWLVLRTQLIAENTLNQIKTSFIDLMDPQSDYYQEALDSGYYTCIAKILRSKRPIEGDICTDNTIYETLLNIVRSYIA